MDKAIKDLTKRDIAAICKRHDTVNFGAVACGGCPLRWGKQCMYCFPPIITTLLYDRMIKAIGDYKVEINKTDKK